MSEKPQRKRTGIYTVDDLKERCWIDETTQCWHWRGGHTSRAPCLRIPAINTKGTMGRALCVLTQGRDLRKGENWYPRCKTLYCANPEHNVSGTVSARRLALKRKHEPIARARISEAMRKRSPLSEEGCSEIRGSDETAEVLAQRHGVSISLVKKIRTAQRRTLRSAAPNSSAFNWCPA